METIKINKCEGYLWWSDQQEPQVFENQSIDQCLNEVQNPFVVEGQLYDKEEKKSYSIKYVDGKYLINKYKVEESDLANPDNESKCYLSNRIQIPTLLGGKGGSGLHGHASAQTDQKCIYRI